MILVHDNDCGGASDVHVEPLTLLREIELQTRLEFFGFASRFELFRFGLEFFYLSLVLLDLAIIMSMTQ